MSGFGRCWLTTAQTTAFETLGHRPWPLHFGDAWTPPRAPTVLNAAHRRTKNLDAGNRWCAQGRFNTVTCLLACAGRDTRMPKLPMKPDATYISVRGSTPISCRPAEIVTDTALISAMRAWVSGWLSSKINRSAASKPHSPKAAERRRQVHQIKDHAMGFPRGSRLLYHADIVPSCVERRLRLRR